MDIDEWINSYLSGKLSEKERQELARWLDVSPEHKSMFCKELRMRLRVLAAVKNSRLEQMCDEVWLRVLPLVKRSRRKIISWWVYAACVVLVVGLGGLLFWFLQPDVIEAPVVLSNVLQTEAGNTKAVLLTSIGGKIVLTDSVLSHSVEIPGVGLIQDSLGVRFVEEEESIAQEDTMGWNTIIVPERGEYFVTLTDGTRVWMNSASKLEFPVRFAENCREVHLEGEAYFEVTPDTQKPFLVNMGEKQVRVLGTSFNVMAYPEDNKTEVALLQGKVSFDVAGKVFVLNPGEIATAERVKGEVMIRKGDVATIIAWKSGVFNFEDMDLVELTVKLSRWYGVDFVFEDMAAKELRFSGAVTKYRSLDYVLDMIAQTTNVEFIENQEKIIIRTRER